MRSTQNFNENSRNKRLLTHFVIQFEIIFFVMMTIILPQKASSQINLGIGNQVNFSLYKDNSWVNYTVFFKSNFSLFKNLSLDLNLGFSPEKYNNLFGGPSMDQVFPDKLNLNQLFLEYHIRVGFLKISNDCTVSGFIGNMFVLTFFRESIYSFHPLQNKKSKELYFNNVFLSCGFGINYLLKRISFQIEPVYYYALINNGIFNNRLALNIGVLFRI